jgi:hypothetical protein
MNRRIAGKILDIQLSIFFVICLVLSGCAKMAVEYSGGVVHAEVPDSGTEGDAKEREPSSAEESAVSAPAAPGESGVMLKAEGPAKPHAKSEFKKTTSRKKVSSGLKAGVSDDILFKLFG